MWLAKLILILIFLIIFFQDTKQRLVYWFLYPLVGIAALIIQANSNNYYISLTHSGINLAIITIMLSTGLLYAKFKMKKKFVNESMGIGDILLFGSLCFAFASVTFVILLIFSLIFSLLLHVYFVQKSEDKTVPLAGYMSLFFAGIYSVSFFIEPKYLFAY